MFKARGVDVCNVPNHLATKCAQCQARGIVNETWVDLEQWMNANLNLYNFKEKPSETQRQVTQGRPSSWAPMRFFRGGKMVDVTPPKPATPPNEIHEINYDQPGRYKPGS